MKVLDFGLAKALGPSEGDGFSRRQAEADASALPTITTPAMTMHGMILGTAADIAPEQARGKAMDRRCLDRDAKQRLRDIGEARVEIAKIESGAPDASVISTASALTKVPAPLWRRAIPVVMGLVLAAVAALAAWTLKPSPPQSTAVTRFSFTLPEGQQFTNTGRQVVSIAPDGSQFVYVANSRLYLKPMSEMSSIFIQGTEIARGALNPVFSPDSKSIAFYSNADRTLKRTAVSGGAAVTVCEVDAPFGISWGTDDEILIGQGAEGIVRVSASGGRPETIVTVKEGELAHRPGMLPGGDVVLFTRSPS